ncbi:MAG TPA: nucleotidyltransferase family protein [Terriglobales bacterium]|jgi:molybdenum cofactor cytidylyltransferase|nr:nucleotidyltransferase family protein [Terriglobales bacterium]
MPEISNAATSVGGILLAAGYSTRFHGDKQLALFQGTPLIVRAAKALQTSGADPIVGIIRPQMRVHEQLLSQVGMPFATNQNSAEGLASSVRAGLEFHKGFGLGAVLVSSCDQPLVTGKHLRELIELWRNCRGAAVASAYSNTIGIPAVFGSELFSQMSELRGDRGAGQLLRHLPNIATLVLPEAAFDIDTPEELGQLESRNPL